MAASMRRRRASQPFLAAVDLGSNSFRMVLAEAIDGQLRRVDSRREGVRLAAALGSDNRLDPEGEARALACLERFGQRLRDLPAANVRAVGTNTLRRARGVGGFLERARVALGHPVEVISGQEEARLIYQGVARELAAAPARRLLVVDIGGGSTECVLGEGEQPQRAESLYMGCVGMTQAFFPAGEIRREQLARAELAAGVELEALAGELRQTTWDATVGASGTVRAVAAVARRNGWCRDGITSRALERVRKSLLDAGDVRSLRLSGLSRERAAVFPGGVAILWSIFTAFGLEKMAVSDGSLREGVLYDLLGRLGPGDVRPRTLARLQEQYRVDLAQAARVEATALALLATAPADWELGGAQAAAWLAWAARVHEIGLAVAHGGYHKHGAYLLTHSELAGFSLQEQRRLALMVRGHRRKLPATLFDELPAVERTPALRLTLLLRLAVLLHRARSPRELPPVTVGNGDRGVRLRFPRGWLEERPLTVGTALVGARAGLYAGVAQPRLRRRDRGTMAYPDGRRRARVAAPAANWPCQTSQARARRLPKAPGRSAQIRSPSGRA
jgi:exopolyphosphatase / guanosine-5'-triphosphate,3'-diphosphate pyrophosphatase